MCCTLLRMECNKDGRCTPPACSSSSSSNVWIVLSKEGFCLRFSPDRDNFHVVKKLGDLGRKDGKLYGEELVVVVFNCRERFNCDCCDCCVSCKCCDCCVWPVIELVEAVESFGNVALHHSSNILRGVESPSPPPLWPVFFFFACFRFDWLRVSYGPVPVVFHTRSDKSLSYMWVDFFPCVWFFFNFNSNL